MKIIHNLIKTIVDKGNIVMMDGFNNRIESVREKSDENYHKKGYYKEICKKYLMICTEV